MASTPWERALVKFQAGDLESALDILQRAVGRAEKERGVDSPAFAEACFHLADLLTAMEDHTGAIQALRHAVAARLPGPPGQKDHVDYVLRLGELLREHGDLAEAEQVQRDGLAAREALHGTEAPGYAFGLIALAEVLVDAHRLAEAAPLLESALVVLWQAGHPAVARAIALRALCIKSTEGTQTESLQPLRPLPTEVFSDAVQQALTLVDRPGHAAAVVALLHELEPWVSERMPGAARDLQAGIAEAARLAGDPLARLQALGELEALAPHPADRVEVLLELAEAQADHGENAEPTYARALAAAEHLDHPELLVVARRAAGDWLAEQGRRAEAQPLLEGAVALARAEDLWEALGIALISLGLFLKDDVAAAQPLLEEGVARLLPGDPRGAEAEALLAVWRPEEAADDDALEVEDDDGGAPPA